MEYEYDYFISYAHKDNNLKVENKGFVDEFVEKLRKSEEHKSMFGEEPKVFFDMDRLRDMEYWDTRIRSSLAKSRFFIVLLSPDYFQSEYCAMEFHWWMQHEMHRRVLGEGAAPMLIVNVDDVYNEKVDPLPVVRPDLRERFPDWVKLIRKYQAKGFDMHDLYRKKIDEVLRNLHQATKDKVFKQNIANESPINAGYPEYNENFVGRRDELSTLRERLSTKSKVAISAVSGLGGIGKTELAITYGHAFAWDYRLGRVFAKCENMTSLEDVLLSCGIAQMYGVTQGKDNKQQQLTALFGKLKRRIKYIERLNQKNNIDKTFGTNLLLILDNVNMPELVSPVQTRLLCDYFHVIITTRESTNTLSHIETLSLERLSENDSVELLSNLHSFGNDSNEAIAARNIAKLLDGFTLAVEITGAYLRQHPSVTYQKQYELLRENLSKAVKAMVDEKPILQNHQAEYISVVLEPTLLSLNPDAREALNYAAQMSPDAVALGWIPEFLGLNEDEGGKVLESLTGYSLLTPLKGEPKIARIHRLVAESLDNQEDNWKIINRIRDKCNNLLGNDDKFWSVPENIWNITPVSEFLKLLGKRWTIESSKIRIDLNLTKMMGIAGGILQSLNKMNDALEVYKLRFEICKKRIEVFDNEDVSQDYMISCSYLRDLGDSVIRLSEKEQADGNADAAKDLCEKALEVYEILATAMPENVDVQRALSVIYVRLGNLEQDAGNADAAQELFAKSQEIIQRLQLDAVSDNNVASKKMQFDYYINYAHKDNQSIDGRPGFVDVFVEKLRNSQEHQKMLGGKVSVFFDKDEIFSMSDWDNRNRFGLSHSRFLIVLVSPNYFKSEYCAREFDWWIQHEWHNSIGESVVPVIILNVNDLYDPSKGYIPDIPMELQMKYPNWVNYIRQFQSDSVINMHPLDCAKIDDALLALRETVKDVVVKQKFAERSPVNASFPRYNENFVGRRENLLSLRSALSTGSSFAICALIGLGGIGKTELSLAYAHAFAWDYGLGRVFVNCENATSLTDILLSCGIAEMNGLTLPNGSAEMQLSFLLGCLEKKRVEIIQRNRQEGNPETLGTHILLILDNVNRLELIASEQLRELPEFFHVIITTRQSSSEFPYIHTQMVDRLSEDESVELLNNLRPFGSDPQESVAAREIARLLDGYTLAVELTGEYLRKSPRVTYQEQYERLSRELSQSSQNMGDSLHGLVEHKMETISMVLMATLSELTPNARRALNYASQMAPDGVGLDWLPELIGLDDEAGFDVIDELIGFNLLSPLEKEPNIARIHRLVANSVKQYISNEESKEIIDDIRNKCNDLLEEDEQFWYVPDNSWNITPVSEFLKMQADDWTVETSDQNIDWDLTRMMNTSGDILKNLGKLIEALNMYKSFYRICQQRVKNMPENVQVMIDLSTSCNNLGDLEYFSVYFASAREWYEKALEISHRLADKMPEDVNVQRNLSVSYCKLGNIENAVGNTAASREWYEKSLEINKRLSEKQPEDVTAQRNLSVSYCKLGDMENAVGNTAASREWYEKSLEISIHFTDLMPDNVYGQQDLSNLYNILGDLEQKAGNVSSARELYEKSLEISKWLADKMPDNVSVLWDLSSSYNCLGKLEQTAGNDAVSREWYEKALYISQQLARKMPENARIQNELQSIQRQINSLEESQSSALETKTTQENNAEESDQAQKELAETREKLAQAQKELAEMQEKLAQKQKPWYIKLLNKLFGKD